MILFDGSDSIIRKEGGQQNKGIIIIDEVKSNAVLKGRGHISRHVTFLVSLQVQDISDDSIGTGKG